MICRMTDLAKSTAEPDVLALPPEMPKGSTVLTGLHARVLDLLGLAVCSGDLASGSVIRIDQLEERHGVSPLGRA